MVRTGPLADLAVFPAKSFAPGSREAGDVRVSRSHWVFVGKVAG